MKYFIQIILYSIIGMGYAQQKEIDLSQRLKIGDNAPVIPRQSMLFDTETKMDLTIYTDKLLILDFFDTYCSSCIASLPGLQKIQRQFKEEIKIIMVTWQDKKTVEKFWKENKFIEENQIELPIIYGDTLLRKYFPHRTIPHVVWLYNGRVEAVTYPDYVDEENIQKLLTNDRIALPQKNDFEDVSSSRPEVQNLEGSSLLSGYQDGRATSTYTYGLDSLTGMFKTSFVNMPIFGAFTATLGKIRKPKFLLKPQRIIWNVKDSSGFDYFSQEQKMQLWLSKNAISYERFDKIKREPHEQAQVVLNDLNAFLGIKAYWAIKKTECLVLRGRFKDDHSLDPESGQRINSTDLLAFHLDLMGKYPPAIDSVKIEKTMYIPPFEDLVELNQHLRRYGLFVVEEMEDIEVLVIEEDS